jgi:hypothetical protein
LPASRDPPQNTEQFDGIFLKEYSYLAQSRHRARRCRLLKSLRFFPNWSVFFYDASRKMTPSLAVTAQLR